MPKKNKPKQACAANNGDNKSGRRRTLSLYNSAITPRCSSYKFPSEKGLAIPGRRLWAMASMIPTSYGLKLVENWLLSNLTAFLYDSSNTSSPFLPNVAGAHALSNSSMAVVPLVLDTIGGRVSLRMALPMGDSLSALPFGGPVTPVT